MALTREQRKQMLASKGFDPEKHDFNEATGDVYAINAMADTEPVITPNFSVTPGKSSSFGTVLRGAAQSTAPSLGGIATGALLGAKTPGPWPVKLGAGILGGIVGAEGIGAIQNALVPESWQKNLFLQPEDYEEHPGMALAGELAPTVLAFNPVKSAYSLGRGLGLLGKATTSPVGMRALTATEKMGLRNFGINTGVNVGTQAGLDVAHQLAGDQPFDFGELARNAALGLVFNEPTKLGQRYLRFKPSFEGVESARDIENRRMAELFKDQAEPIIKPELGYEGEYNEPAYQLNFKARDSKGEYVESDATAREVFAREFPELAKKANVLGTGLRPNQEIKLSMEEIREFLYQVMLARSNMADVHYPYQPPEVEKPPIISAEGIPAPSFYSQPGVKGKGTEIGQRKEYKPGQKGPFKYSEKSRAQFSAIEDDILRLLARRGVNIGKYRAVITDEEGLPVKGERTGKPIAGRARYGERTVDFGIEAGADTAYHEAFHIQLEDLARSPDPKDRQRVTDAFREMGSNMTAEEFAHLNDLARQGVPGAKERFIDLEEALVDSIGFEGGQRALNRGIPKFKQYIKDTLGRFGLGKEPARQKLSAGLEYDAPITDERIAQNAPKEIQIKGGLQREREEGVSGGEETKAIFGDSLRRTAEGEEVLTKAQEESKIPGGKKSFEDSVVEKIFGNAGWNTSDFKDSVQLKLTRNQNNVFRNSSGTIESPKHGTLSWQKFGNPTDGTGTILVKKAAESPYAKLSTEQLKSLQQMNKTMGLNTADIDAELGRREGKFQEESQMKEAPVVYKGFQPGFGKIPGMHLYNITGEGEGLVKNSTVTENSLRKLGYSIPAAEKAKEGGQGKFQEESQFPGEGPILDVAGKVSPKTKRIMSGMRRQLEGKVQKTFDQTNEQVVKAIAEDDARHEQEINKLKNLVRSYGIRDQKLIDTIGEEGLSSANVKALEQRIGVKNADKLFQDYIDSRALDAATAGMQYPEGAKLDKKIEVQNFKENELGAFKGDKFKNFSKQQEESGLQKEDINLPRSYGHWISPEGEMFRVFAHEPGAIEILQDLVKKGRMSQADYDRLNIPLNSTTEVENELYKRGYIRGVHFGPETYYANGKQPLTPRQISALKNYGIERDSSVAHTSGSGEGGKARYIYERPYGGSGKFQEESEPIGTVRDYLNTNNYVVHGTDTTDKLESILQTGIRPRTHMSNSEGQGLDSGPYVLVYPKKQFRGEEVSYRPGDYINTKVSGKPRLILFDDGHFMEKLPIEALEERMIQAGDRLEKYIQEKYGTKISEGGENIWKELGDKGIFDDRRYKGLQTRVEQTSDEYFNALDNPNYKPQTGEDYYREAQEIGRKYGIPVKRMRYSDSSDDFVFGREDKGKFQEEPTEEMKRRGDKVVYGMQAQLSDKFDASMNEFKAKQAEYNRYLKRPKRERTEEERDLIANQLVESNDKLVQKDNELDNLEGVRLEKQQEESRPVVSRQADIARRFNQAVMDLRGRGYRGADITAEGNGYIVTYYDHSDSWDTGPGARRNKGEQIKLGVNQLFIPGKLDEVSFIADNLPSHTKILQAESRKLVDEVVGRPEAETNERFRELLPNQIEETSKFLDELDKPQLGFSAKQKLQELNRLKSNWEERKQDYEGWLKDAISSETRDSMSESLEEIKSQIKKVDTKIEKIKNSASKFQEESRAGELNFKPALNITTSVTDRIATHNTPSHTLASRALKNTFDERSFLEGKYGNRAIAVLNRFSPEDVNRWYHYSWFRDNDMAAPFNLTPKQQALDNAIRPIIESPKRDAKDISLLVKRGEKYTPPGIKATGYLPNQFDPRVLAAFENQPNGIESKKYRRQWKEWLEKKGAHNADEIMDAWFSARRTYGDTGGPEFNALRKAEGYGLPWELMDQNPGRAFRRYARRAAADISFFKHIQSDPKLRHVLGIKDQEGNLPTKVPDLDFIGTEKDVESAMSFIYGKDNQSNFPRLDAFARLVGNMIMGPGTAARNLAAMPAQLAGYDVRLKDYFKALADFSNSRKRAFESNAVRADFSEFEKYGDIDNPDRAVATLDKLSSFFRKWQGRNLSDKWEGEIYYAIGEQWARTKQLEARAGNERSKDLLERVGNLSKDVLNPSPENIQKLATGFVNTVRGTYGPQGLPAWALKGNLAPFAALSRYSIERWNNVYKDIWLPAKKGNIKPLLAYTLSSLGTGLGIEQLNQLLSGRKGAELDTNEALAAYAESEKPEILGAKTIGLLQLASFAGIVGDMAKLGERALSGQSLKYSSPLSFPAYTFATETVAQNLAEALGAIRDGEDPIDTMAELIRVIGTQSIQGARYISNRAMPEETQRKEELGDLRKYREATGRKDVEPYAGTDEFGGKALREFKRTPDLGEAIGVLPDLLAKAFKQAGNDPYKLKAELRKIKQNSYQSMPAPETQPLEFYQYLQYLRKTQGEDVAAQRLSKFLTQRAVNQAKASVVP